MRRMHPWATSVLLFLASISYCPAQESTDSAAPIVSLESYYAPSRVEGNGNWQETGSLAPSGVIPASHLHGLATSTACDQGRCDSILGSCSGGCTSGCSDCLPWWAHCHSVFGELLFLNPGSSDLIYAVEQTDPTPSASPTGPMGISNVEDELGYRVGGAYALSCKSSLVGTFTRWDGDTTDVLNATGNNVLNSQVIHPSTATTGAASLQATAYQRIGFQLADLVYRRVHRAWDCGVINWNMGVRYSNLEQGLVASQTVSVPSGLTTVTTDVDFEGFGILAGIDGERRAPCSGCLIYGKVLGSMNAGNWQADYTQTNQFGGGVIANHYEDFRITPILDTELGFGWQSKCGTWRVTSGYMFSTWFNSVNNRDYIAAVRSGNMLELDDWITFSGLTFRTEARW
ncbi:MAG: hypothetical protein KatS3mg111_1957 [Pirellulaceae bacterium]|nr:MAG: hypothetical protein KatS3mg111_1957 [Pirellulaceae bacterium]